MLAVILKDDSTTIKRIGKMIKQANASAKPKEVQLNPQTDTVAPHLLLP